MNVLRDVLDKTFKYIAYIVCDDYTIMALADHVHNFFMSGTPQIFSTTNKQQWYSLLLTLSTAIKQFMRYGGWFC